MNGAAPNALAGLLRGVSLGSLADLFAGPADDSLRELATELGIPVGDLAGERARRSWTYRRFQIRKRGGGKRTIDAPSQPLKRLQRRLLHSWLDREPVHHAATAFRRGSSIAAHAAAHLGQEILSTVDLADFFPSTSAARVRSWFLARGRRGEALDALMRLCTYRGSLPQGAPTSPALSNLVNRELDEAIAELATTHGAQYTRYCDDLAFSWGTASDPTSLQMRIEDVLRRYGYRVGTAKGWRTRRLDSRPELLGLTLDGTQLRLARDVVARRRELSRRWFRTPEENQRLQGFRGLAKMLKAWRTPW